MESIISLRESYMERLDPESKIIGKQYLRPVISPFIYVLMHKTNEELHEAALGKLDAEGSSGEVDKQYKQLV